MVLFSFILGEFQDWSIVTSWLTHLSPTSGLHPNLYEQLSTYPSLAKQLKKNGPVDKEEDDSEI